MLVVAILVVTQEEPRVPSRPTLPSAPTSSRSSPAAAQPIPGGAGGLTLSSNAATSHGNLVGVASPTTGEIRVIANDATNSYLVKKLEGTASAGSRMPIGGSALDNTDLTNIKNWINTGAPNN